MDDFILPQLESIEWSVEVILASSDPSMTMKPLVRLSFKCHNQTFELTFPMDKFGELRFKVAEALQILGDVKQSKILANWVKWLTLF